MTKSLSLARVLFAGALLAGVAPAQSADGFVSFGGGHGGGVGIAEFAGGGEFVFAQTVGVGGEIGYVGRHSGFGFASIDGSVHIGRHAATGKMDPFVTGGYTRAFSLFSGTNGGNFGFGLNYWLKPHFGIRGEFRDMIFDGGLSNVNYWAFRFGVSLR